MLLFMTSLAHATTENYTVQIQHFGDQGQYEAMDSIYTLAVRQINYENNPVSALDIHITYATYLNAKGESKKAYTILDKARKEARRLEADNYPSEIQKQIKQHEGIATYEMAYGLWSDNELDKAKELTDEAIDLFIQSKDSSYLAESYNLAGVIHKRLFRLDKAIIMYKQALKITETQKDYGTSAIIVNNISTLYNELEEFPKAIQFSRRIFSYPVADTLALSNRITRIGYLCNHATLLTNSEYYSNALDSLRLAIGLIQENMPDGLKLYAYTNYAKAFRDTGNKQKAFLYYQKAMSYREQTSNAFNKANLDYLYGYMLFHDTDSLVQAHHYLSRALRFYRENPSIMLVKSLLSLAELEAQRNNFRESYALTLEAYKAEQRIQNKNFHNRLAGFEAELKTKEKDLEIISLNAQRAKEKSAYQTRIYTIAGILTLAILLSVILVISMRKRKMNFRLKQMELERELKDKEIRSQLLIDEMNEKMTERYLCGLEDSNDRISKELHDGICNELLSIEMNLNQTDKNQLTTQISQVRENVRNLSHRLSAPHFENMSLYQMLNLYIEKLNTLGVLHIHPYISDDVHGVTLTSDRLLEVYRIAQEAISNVLKHANAQNMYLTVSFPAGNVDIIIEDDGKGFDYKETSSGGLSTGIGLRSIKERSHKLRGGCEVESAKGKGTIVHLWFPVE